MMTDYHTREGPARQPPGAAPELLTTMRLVAVVLLLPVLHGCSAGTDAGIEDRTLATIDAALENDPTADLLAQQHRLFEALAENRRDELPQYLDLAFSFHDLESPTPPVAAAVGSGYLPRWRENGGLNYYQFIAREIPEHAWAGRTLEIVWSVPRVALVVAHHDERDPVFTQWEYRQDGWKAVRLTINAAEETLQQARETRRMNR